MSDPGPAYRIFDGLAYRPRCVEVVPGRWVCIATGQHGIRVVDVPPLVLDVPPPAEIVPLPDGTVIPDTLPYVLGHPSRWPRVGPDNMDAVPVSGQDAVTWVKFASPSFCEWWRWDDAYVYHHEDRSDGLDAPYHFSPDDRWIRRRWAVGRDAIDCRANNTIRRTADNGEHWSAKPFAYVMRFVAAFASYPCGGDIGDAPVIVVEYDPTYTLTPRRGFVERFWFAAGWGWWRWQSFRYGTDPGFGPPTASASDSRILARRQRGADDAPTELVDATFSRLGGQRVTPIAPVRPWTPPVDPPEEPMPSQPYPSEPDYWQNVVLNDTRADYAEANRPLDDFYPIWTARTAYDIAAGLTKEASWKKHRNELRAALSLPPL